MCIGFSAAQLTPQMEAIASRIPRVPELERNEGGQRFFEEVFPLIIAVAPSGGYDEPAIAQMAAYYEQLWAKGKRYALITASPKGAVNPTARSRKLIVDWANQPKVREMSGKHCVASSTIVSNVFVRGALTAILWLWTPPSPHLAAGNPEEAIDYTLAAIDRAKLPTRVTPALMRERALAYLRGV
jgi:hypothetical protein